MNPLKLPHQKDVTEFDLGNGQVKLIKLTDENRPGVLDFLRRLRLGEKCKYCLKTYETLEDLKTAVYAGDHEYGCLACKECWRENNNE